MPGSRIYSGIRERLQGIIAANRVHRMEQCFDELQAAVREDPEALRNAPKTQKQLRRLVRYYEGGSG